MKQGNLNIRCTEDYAVLYWDKPAAAPSGAEYTVSLNGEAIGRTDRTHFTIEGLSYGSSFRVDVVSGSYYEKAVAWAIENGITTGTTTSTFSPDATCTRAQAVTFLARALKAKAASAAEFSDVPTGSYFADAVAWAAANGVTEGIGGGLFGSDNDCTRGQIVTFLYRAYNK